VFAVPEDVVDVDDIEKGLVFEGKLMNFEIAERHRESSSGSRGTITSGGSAL
jgi:hypothetical protein